MINVTILNKKGCFVIAFGPRAPPSCSTTTACDATGLCHESGCHSLQLHITHGLHLPSCTAHTHSRPPLHQSHSCHHSLHVSVDLPESHHVSVDLPESPHASADLPESPHASADLPESPRVTAVYPVSLHVPAVSSALPWWAPVSLSPHGPGPPFPPPVPPPLHRPPGLCRVCVKRLEAALWGWGALS